MLFAMMGIGIVWGLPDLGRSRSNKNLDAPGGLGTPGGDQTDPATTGEDPTTTDLDDDAGEGAGEGGKRARRHWRTGNNYTGDRSIRSRRWQDGYRI